jgi:hypothetical protein
MNIDPNFPGVSSDFEYRGKECSVTVYKTGKVTYTATGRYGNKSVVGSGARSIEQALESWKKTVQYRDPTD